MLTDKEKNLVRMMVVNTTPEYMAEVAAMDDDTVRAKISEFVEARSAEINRGLEIYTQRMDADKAEVERLTAIKTILEA